MPATSSHVGSCVRTITPITVAVAGRRATYRAYVPRGSRAIASWSNTYGITDEETPTAIPAASATGSVSARAASVTPIGVSNTHAMSIAAARPSTPPAVGRRERRCARTMYKVNSAAFANANATPTGSPLSRKRVRR
jgi:hypothetical protein